MNQIPHRYVPVSLHARLLAIVLLTIVVLQVVSLASVGAWRGWQVRELANGLIVSDLQHQLTRLQGLAAPERPGALQHQERGDYGWQLVAATRFLPEDADTELQTLARAAVQRGVQGAHAVRWQSQPALRVRLDQNQDLLMCFVQPLPSTRPSLGAALSYVALLGLLVGAIAWWAVSLVTAPLLRVTRAAQALTANLQQPALPEEGSHEVRALAQSINALQSEVLRQLRARTGILAVVTHDLKSPLTRMKLRTSLLTDPDFRRRLEQDLDAMDALVDEGLAYARSEQLHESLVPVDLMALIDNLVDQAVDMGHRCSVSGCVQSPLMAAPRALQRLLQNLLDNALRYGGSAEIELTEDADGVVVTVSDRGPGLAEADLERMFEPFVRGDNSRGRDLGGTGLGLAIARNIAQAHRANLVLRNRVGGGLMARLQFPGRQDCEQGNGAIARP